MTFHDLLKFHDFPLLSMTVRTVNCAKKSYTKQTKYQQSGEIYDGCIAEKPSSCWGCVVSRDPARLQSLAVPSNATSESSEHDLGSVHTVTHSNKQCK